MTISDLKAGQEFMMEGITHQGVTVQHPAKMIRYNGMNKYVILSGGITILVDGTDKVTKVIK